MPRVSDTYGSSESWKADDLEGKDLTLKIRNVDVKKFDEGAKLIVTFHNSDKSLILNKTNSEIIAELYGDDTDDWIRSADHIVPDQDAVQWQARALHSGS